MSLYTTPSPFWRELKYHDVVTLTKHSGKCLGYCYSSNHVFGCAFWLTEQSGVGFTFRWQSPSRISFDHRAAFELTRLMITCVLIRVIEMDRLPRVVWQTCSRIPSDCHAEWIRQKNANISLHESWLHSLECTAFLSRTKLAFPGS